MLPFNLNSQFNEQSKLQPWDEASSFEDSNKNYINILNFLREPDHQFPDIIKNGFGDNFLKEISQNKLTIPPKEKKNSSEMDINLQHYSRSKGRIKLIAKDVIRQASNIGSSTDIDTKTSIQEVNDYQKNPHKQKSFDQLPLIYLNKNDNIPRLRQHKQSLKHTQNLNLQFNGLKTKNKLDNTNLRKEDSLTQIFSTQYFNF